MADGTVNTSLIRTSNRNYLTEATLYHHYSRAHYKCVSDDLCVRARATREREDTLRPTRQTTMDRQINTFQLNDGVL